MTRVEETEGERLAQGDAAAPRVTTRRGSGSGESRPPGAVRGIFLAPRGGAPMEGRTEVRAVRGRGLEGDRYFRGVGSWSRPGLWSHVTLVEAEVEEFLLREIGLRVPPEALRRNVVVTGVDLTCLEGTVFRIGDAVLRGIRPCHPCRPLEERLGIPGLASALRGRGGLRAAILRGGVLRSGAGVGPWIPDGASMGAVVSVDESAPARRKGP